MANCPFVPADVRLQKGLQVDYDLDVAMDPLEQTIDQDVHSLPMNEATGSLKVA